MSMKDIAPLTGNLIPTSSSSVGIVMKNIPTKITRKDKASHRRLSRTPQLGQLRQLHLVIRHAPQGMKWWPHDGQDLGCR